MTDRSQRVKELFENTALYLTYDYNLQIRRETVEAFTEGRTFRSVLDIPCGTGAMSVPLLHRAEHLTMIDISSNMLGMAKDSVPEEQKNKVTCINGDFFDMQLPAQSFDLVISLGLLAHVNSPEQLLKKLSDMVMPGGLLILQNTDASHPYSHLIRLYLGMKHLVKKQPYKLNKVKASFVENTLEELGFEKQAAYRYNQSFLGFSNFFSNAKKYTMTRRFFGEARQNRHPHWGSDYTYLFVKKN